MTVADARNQLSALTSPLAETVYYQYDALGREIARRLPNTVTTYHNYDAASQVASLIHRGPSSVLQSLYYSYDADGQRTKIEREDNTRIYYSYDSAHRLTGEDWLDPSNVHLYAFAYQYDAAGNRLKQTFNSATTYYSYNNLNELTSERILGGAATYYTWTADGEMATKHDTAGWAYYTWDVDESLKTIQTPSVTLESKYNSRMQRVWRSENGTAEKLIYDAQKLIAEATNTGTALNRYYLSEGGSVYSPLLAQLGSEHWFLFDALGTTLGLTSTTGSLTDTFKYEAFGTSLGRTGTTQTPYQYVGGYGYFNEPSVGLEQVWHRWLRPSSVIWLSAREMGADWSSSNYARSAPFVYPSIRPAPYTGPVWRAKEPAPWYLLHPIPHDEPWMYDAKNPPVGIPSGSTRNPSVVEDCRGATLLLLCCSRLARRRRRNKCEHDAIVRYCIEFNTGEGQEDEVHLNPVPPPTGNYDPYRRRVFPGGPTHPETEIEEPPIFAE